MIDIHQHGIFNVDDGCENIEESIELLKEASKQGVFHVICTPHFILDGKYHENGIDVVEGLKKLQKRCLEEKIELFLHVGHELFIHRLLPHCLKENKCLTLAGSRYVLVEFPFDEYQEEYDHILEDLRAMGYVIVIAHPERYSYVRKDVNFCLRWLDQGDLLQCNQNSFLNKDLKKMMMRMLKHHFISFVASDAHGGKRPCRLKQVYDVIAQWADQQTAEQLLDLNPQKILNDELIENDEYEPVKKILGVF